MRTNVLFYTVTGLVCGLTLGFVFANHAFRVESQQNPGLPASVQNNSAPPEVFAPQNSPNAVAAAAQNKLSNEELRLAIAQADAQPTDLKVQENIGLSLGQYALLEGKLEVLPDVVRILRRVEAADQPNSQLVTGALGDALFILGQESGAQTQIREAGEYFKKAEKSNPTDADLQCKIGLTYYLSQPADLNNAIGFYNKALKLNPAHEKALESLTQALIQIGETDQAQQSLAALKKSNPQNTQLKNLEIELVQSKLVTDNNK